MRLANFAAAIVFSVAILYVSFVGAGPLPALGPAFNPGTGAWTMAFDASIGRETQHLTGLQQPVRINVGGALACVGHFAALAEQRVGFVEEQQRARTLRFLEERLEIVLGFAEVSADEAAEIDAVEGQSRLVGQYLPGHGLARAARPGE